MFWSACIVPVCCYGSSLCVQFQSSSMVLVCMYSSSSHVQLQSNYCTIPVLWFNFYIIFVYISVHVLLLCLLPYFNFFLCFTFSHSYVLFLLLPLIFNFGLSSNITIVLLLSIFFSCVLISILPFIPVFHFYFFHFIFISLTLHFILLSIYHIQFHLNFFPLSHSYSYVSFIILFYSFIPILSAIFTQHNLNLCSYSFQCIHLYNIYLFSCSIFILFWSCFNFIHMFCMYQPSLCYIWIINS
jgi:hypothetical protein